MVVYGSSPKRRRTDEKPSAQQIADTNATLHALANQGQNRWQQMQNSWNPMFQQERAASTSGNSDARTSRDTALGSINNAHSTTAQAGRPSSLNLKTTAGPSSIARQDLLNHESPDAVQVPTPMTATAILQSRRPSITTPNGNLPSPAPSEDHTNSPASVTVVPEDPEMGLHSHSQPKRPRRKPRKFSPTTCHLTGAALVRSHYAGQPAVPNILSQPSSIRDAALTAPSNSRRKSVANSNNTALSPQSMILPPKGGLFGVDRMRQRLSTFFKPQDHTINSIDIGRRTLVQEAIETGDFLYLALSQVFCLYTVRRMVPKPLERVHPSSWRILEQLICSNSAMTPGVVKWFAEFPAPVHIILANSTGESQFYMNQLTMIENFLQELPRTWPLIVEVSKRRLAPPLTQEMVEELYLISPVIQTTVFRAITRLVWGNDENPGLRLLESLHKIDQQTYISQQWRRSKDEMQVAYGVYTQVFHAWRDQRVRHGGIGPDSFARPLACDYFKQPPPSMHFPGNGMNDHGQHSWRAAQQLQTMEMNYRILSQRQAAPASQTNPPTQLQIPQYQSNPPFQPHPAPAFQYKTYGLTPLQPTPPQQILPPNVVPPHLSRLLPSENAAPRPLPVQPDTVRVSLHQAHLRSPMPGKVRPDTADQPLYRHVAGYALVPIELDSKLCAQTVTLSIPEADFDNIPRTAPGLSGEPGARILHEGSILYRLRCSKVPPLKGFDTEAAWVAAENVWPETLTFQLNDQYLEPRRKLHHGRCLPIDLSPLMHASANILNIYTVPSARDKNAYVVAIERVAVCSHATIVSAVTPISATDSLETIKSSLASTPDEDDDIAMTSSVLTIPLFDPYRADRICVVPVRGTACLHRECFDLETFLSQCKREQPGFPCVPDCWRCPICKGDVRPQTLVKDGFLEQVRNELEQKGILETRAIIVEADGTWKPRAEDKPLGLRSASLERGEVVAAGAEHPKGTARKGKQTVVEIIELD
jgi:hypothetical protein